MLEPLDEPDALPEVPLEPDALPLLPDPGPPVLPLELEPEPAFPLVLPDPGPPVLPLDPAPLDSPLLEPLPVLVWLPLPLPPLPPLPEPEVEEHAQTIPRHPRNAVLVQFMRFSQERRGA